MREASLQSIYTSQLSEATMRLLAAKKFLASYTATGDLPDIEAAILQLRKALETIAFAAIAPDKQHYAALRAKATESPDFTRDYHAAKIFTALAKVNIDFYPVALVPAVRQPDNTWFYDKKKTGYLTKKRFERVYDRLGKHLHADNPWSGSKNIQNLATEMPTIIDHAHGLLDLHVRFIRTPGLRVHGFSRPIVSVIRLGLSWRTPLALTWSQTTNRRYKSKTPHQAGFVYGVRASRVRPARRTRVNA